MPETEGHQPQRGGLAKANVRRLTPAWDLLPYHDLVTARGAKDKFFHGPLTLGGAGRVAGTPKARGTAIATMRKAADDSQSGRGLFAVLLVGSAARGSLPDSSAPGGSLLADGVTNEGTASLHLLTRTVSRGLVLVRLFTVVR